MIHNRQIFQNLRSLWREEFANWRSSKCEHGAEIFFQLVGAASQLLTFCWHNFMLTESKHNWPLMKLVSLREMITADFLTKHLVWVFNKVKEEIKKVGFYPILFSPFNQYFIVNILQIRQTFNFSSAWGNSLASKRLETEKFLQISTSKFDLKPTGLDKTG